MIVLLMGVSGAGKTTVGRALAERMEWAFYDADDFHDGPSIDKMSRGEGLTDADRTEWLDRLAGLIRGLTERREPAVLACSALKARYRARLENAAPGVRLVYLKASPALIRSRLSRRTGHFAGPALLETQFADLEPPDAALVLDASLPVALLVDRAIAALDLANGVR